MKKIMTFGTFDIVHKGHEYYLREAKKLGDFLITVIARDTTVSNLKGKIPRNSEQDRLKNLIGLGIADEVILGSKNSYYDVLLKYRPDILCFGYDQRSFNGQELTEYLGKHNLAPQIVVVGGFEPEKWKSSKL